MARVVGIVTAARQVTVSGVSTITGTVDGALPTSSFTTSDLEIVTTQLDPSSDNTSLLNYYNSIFRLLILLMVEYRLEKHLV